jgi:fatty acid desaturase
MLHAATTPWAAAPLKSDRRLKRKLRELCRTDNHTNFWYIAKVYAVLAATIGGAIWFYHFRQAAGMSFVWNFPLTFLAVLVIGASHHQLAGAGHEATHHTLFKNRLLNELASDWLCMFPILSTTYSFRLFHLAHHQFINDPQRDPDFALLERSGHWLRFPVSKAKFLWKIFSQFLLVGLVRYILARFRFNAVGVAVEGSPYQRSETASKLPVRLGVWYFAGILLLQIPLYFHGDVMLVIAAAALCWGALAAAFCLMPAHFFEAARLRPVVPRRVLAMSRTFYVTALFTTLTVLQLQTGEPAWWYFLWLWIVPLTTTFSLFMILRQLIQHGNGDRGWLTNTRVFLVNRLVRYAVFPFGMDYHLPHHMYATVPHYNLPELHRFLQRYPEYAEQALVVENYVIPKSRRHDRNPTCVEVVGPEYARRDGEAHVDNSVLDAWEVDEREEILHQSQISRGASAEPASPLRQ